MYSFCLIFSAKSNVKDLEDLISAIGVKFNEDLPSDALRHLNIELRQPPPFQSHDLFAVFVSWCFFVIDISVVSDTLNIRGILFHC